jgi:uncharacterized membrane protein YcaP (DUF421 family)
MFGVETPLLETFLRGSLMYLGLFTLMRVVLRRESGNVGITDTLVVVLLADAAQNGMADDYRSITDGILLVTTILIWSHILNYLGYKSKFFQRLLRSPKLMVIKNGRLLRQNMRKELITVEELMTEIRKSGYERVDEIDRGYMESDGSFSFVNRKEKPPKHPDVPAGVL